MVGYSDQAARRLGHDPTGPKYGLPKYCPCVVIKGRATAKFVSGLRPSGSCFAKILEEWLAYRPESAKRFDR